MDKFVPKKRQRFRAYLLNDHPGKEHFGSPFKCVEKNAHRVLGIDRLGFVCILNKHDFFFEPVLNAELRLVPSAVEGTKN